MDFDPYYDPFYGTGLGHGSNTGVANDGETKQVYSYDGPEYDPFTGEREHFVQAKTGRGNSWQPSKVKDEPFPAKANTGRGQSWQPNRGTKFEVPSDVGEGPFGTFNPSNPPLYGEHGEPGTNTSPLGNPKKKMPKRQIVYGDRVSISQCTKRFAWAQRNPFQAFYRNIPEVCMPDTVVLPTAKKRVVSKGNGSTGTYNLGFLYGCPHVVSNDVSPCVVYSLINNDQASGSVVSAVTGQQGSHYSESNFGAADFAAGALQFRTCGFGIRIRYNGREDAMGGTVYAYRSPANTNTSGLTAAEIMSHKETVRFRFDKNWKTIVWKVSDPSDLDFNSAQDGTAPMIFIIESTGADTTFEWEAVNFHELVGTDINDQTMSHSDPVGMGATQAMASSEPDSFSGSGPGPESIWGKVANHIATASSTYQPCSSNNLGTKKNTSCKKQKTHNNSMQVELTKAVEKGVQLGLKAAKGYALNTLKDVVQRKGTPFRVRRVY